MIKLFTLNRTIKFEKNKIPDDTSFLKYYELSDGYIQNIIVNYCIDNNITLKSLQFDGCKCKTKIKGNKQDVYNFVTYLMLNCDGGLINFKYTLI